MRVAKCLDENRARVVGAHRSGAGLCIGDPLNDLTLAIGRGGAHGSVKVSAGCEEAVAAYRAALEERTRERVPLDWATTQNNLGAALPEKLGERESGTAQLEEAVAAYRAALKEERTRERVPLQWATTQKTISATRSRRSGGGRATVEARGGGRGLPGGAGGMDARTRAAPIGRGRNTISAPRSERSGSGERDGAARGGGRGLPGGAGGMSTRNQCRWTGRRRKTISALRSKRSGSGRAGRRGSRRRSRLLTRAWPSPTLSGHPNGFDLSRKPAAIETQAKVAPWVGLNRSAVRISRYLQQ